MKIIKCDKCGQEVPKGFRGIWINYLKGKEVRGNYFGEGSFGGEPDCYKFKDVKKAFEKFEKQELSRKTTKQTQSKK